MSILAQQNIMNGVDDNDKWAANLGKEHHRPSPVGFTGFSYSPVGLEQQLGAETADRRGATGRLIMNDMGGGTGYGPGFNRLADLDSGMMISSLLTSIAELAAGKQDAWSTQTSSERMRQTFTSGDQMRSLWNAEVGVNGTPVASGGQFAGYQNDHRYGISNWLSADEVQVGNQRTATWDDSFKSMDTAESMADIVVAGVDTITEDEGQETVRPVIDITATGLRAIPGMMGPRSDSGNGESSADHWASMTG